MHSQTQIILLRTTLLFQPTDKHFKYKATKLEKKLPQNGFN